MQTIFISAAIECTFNYIVSITIIVSFPADTAASATPLSSKESRMDWEREFSTRYVQPVLQNLDAELNAAMDSVANDKRQGNCNCMTTLRVIIHAMYNDYRT